jgi:hypothetical protein
MYVCGLGARRCIKTSLNVPPVALKLKNLGAPRVPHGDSVNDLFKGVVVAEAQEVVSGAVERLLRSRSLEAFRLRGDYLVAIDGTWLTTFAEPHADNCLTQKHADKSMTYYYMVLEAKLVCANGLSLSLMTEFIENADPNATKQDCELKAFKRLAEGLKKRFPRLPITILGDGMFAVGTVMEICERYHWHHEITLKDKDLPSVMEEVAALGPMQSNNQARRTLLKGSHRIRQEVSWVTDITYRDSEKRDHVLTVITCVETQTTTQRKPRRSKRTLDEQGAVLPPKPVTQTTTFRWITNHQVNTDNIWALMPGGRERWNIENGFNDQKNRGDLKLEHAYSYDPNAVKVFYLMLQLAHMIIQLLYKSDLLDGTSASVSEKLIASMAELAKNMREAWRNVCILDGLFDTSGRFQIRFRLPLPSG